MAMVENVGNSLTDGPLLRPVWSHDFYSPPFPAITRFFSTIFAADLQPGPIRRDYRSPRSCRLDRNGCPSRGAVHPYFRAR